MTNQQGQSALIQSLQAMCEQEKEGLKHYYSEDRLTDSLARIEKAFAEKIAFIETFAGKDLWALLNSGAIPFTFDPLEMGETGYRAVQLTVRTPDGYGMQERTIPIPPGSTPKRVKVVGFVVPLL